MHGIEDLPGGGVRLRIRVQPKASRTAFTTDDSGRLRLAVTAPPADGAANDLVVKTVAKTLGVASRAVTLVSGLKSREKVLEVIGVTGETARARLLQLGG